MPSPSGTGRDVGLAPGNGNGGGDGGGDGPPNQYHHISWIIWQDPPPTGPFTASQPGALAPFSLNASFSWIGLDNIVVGFTIDGVNYTVPVGASTSLDGEWVTTFRIDNPRVYRAGTIQVSAHASGTYVYEGKTLHASKATQPASIAIVLASPTPDLDVWAPVPGILGTPATQPLKAYTQDLGTRQIDWRIDGGGWTGAFKNPATDRVGWQVWTAAIPVSSLPLGPRAIDVRSTQVIGGLSTVKTVTITAADQRSPVFQIFSPEANHIYLWDQAVEPGGIAIALAGTAQDDQTGVKRVEWSVNGSAAAQAQTSDGWLNWQAAFKATDFGHYTLTATALDGSNNSISGSREFEIVSGYAAKSLGERLNRRFYLAALLALAYERVKQGTAPLTATTLAQVFSQPFSRLVNPPAGGQDPTDEPLNQLRLIVSILRRALTIAPDAPSPRARPLVAQWTLDASSIITNGTAQLALDASGAGHTCPLGSIDVVTGHTGGGVMWSAPNPASVDVSSDVVLGASDGDYTVAAWINVAAGDDDTVKPMFVQMGAGGLGLTVRQKSRVVTLNVETDLQAVVTVASDALPVATWVHVACTKRSREVALYVDGALKGRAMLSGPTAALAAPVMFGSQVTAIDDLRIYRVGLTAESIKTLAEQAPQPVPSALEADYRKVAYEALLAAIGTSYQELRVMRGADTATRTSLAARLGVPLRYANDPTDTLDQLTLANDTLTEAALERLFGLRDSNTTASDTPAPKADPLILTWRQATLSAVWVAQDRSPAAAARSFAAIVDPDLVGEADLTSGPGRTIVEPLWKARRAELDAFRASLQTTWSGHAAQPEAFDAVLAAGWPSGIDLPALDTAQNSGVDIRPQLQALLLSREAFDYLLRLRRLATTNAIDDDERGELFDIIASTDKARRVPVWTQEEALVSLSPDFFVVAESTASMSHWLVTDRMRGDWEYLLATRGAQRTQLGAALSAGVDAAEKLALPRLRDALIAAAAPGVATSQFPEIADWLTERYQIDVNADGSLPSTRILQAIETLQSTLLSVRTQRLPIDHPAASWEIDDLGAFDREWSWIGTFEAWQSAMLVLRYPENVLLPTVVRAADDSRPSDAYGAVRWDLRSLPRLSPVQARALYAAAYPDLPVEQRTEQLSVAQLDARRQLAAANPDFNKFWSVPMMLALKLQDSGEYVAALDWMRTTWAYDLPQQSRAIADVLVHEHAGPANLAPGPAWLDHLNPHEIAKGAGGAPKRPTPYTRFTVLSLARCYLQFGDAEFTRDTGESVARARDLYLTARELLELPELQPFPNGSTEEEFDNPTRVSLLQKVTTQLAKLRQGRNIAGLQRVVDLPADAATTFSTVPPPPSRPPTAYRYRTLVDRAKQLTALAQQMEAEYLSALEKKDQKAYQRFQANQALDLARENVTLNALRVSEAQDGVVLAQSQKDRTDLLADHYQQLLTSGRTEHERAMLDDYVGIAGLRSVISTLETTSAVLSLGGQAVSGGAQSFGAASGFFIAAAGALATKAAIEPALEGKEMDLQVDTFRASEERRIQDWQLQVETARQDGVIAQNQIHAAEDHVAVTKQEQAIAQLQVDQAAATLEYLDHQFTNVELYEWMSSVLADVYAGILQQATSTARLAQQQLAFERQESALAVIRTDYWQPAVDLAGDTTKDRAGLTGAERLQADLVQLDQYAFMTDRRRLNITQTFSLADRAPLEIQLFRDTGVLQFATPMEWFDSDFPGHYLRLIRRVRASVVALVPPSRGIRASLTCSGISRVVIGGDTFSEVVMRRDPETVALTAPTNASGVFDLDTQADILLPFEQMGVATDWQLVLPKAANPFDYGSIADVAITIDYTALEDYGYRQQVVDRLNAAGHQSGERSYSLRLDFPDQWYELHNPAPSTPQRTVQLPIGRGDFAPNLDGLLVENLVVYIAPASDPIPDLPVTLGLGTASAQAQLLDGLISTRRGNGAPWAILQGIDPTGTWQLTFDAATAAALFDDDRAKDVLLVIGYTGRAPAWPS